MLKCFDQWRKNAWELVQWALICRKNWCPAIIDDCRKQLILTVCWDFPSNQARGGRHKSLSGHVVPFRHLEEKAGVAINWSVSGYVMKFVGVTAFCNFCSALGRMSLDGMATSPWKSCKERQVTRCGVVAYWVLGKIFLHVCGPGGPDRVFWDGACLM